ncbi:MAG: metal ABC transporter ATP-binding protein [Candidatus Wildermuthbacteria bacterium]|nr:metal ABC transporter ATP-binding protein [Candidatus Wildermuthbacteria bacterium]
MHPVNHQENILEIQNVSFSYSKGTEAVRNITLSVHRGDYVGLIGPNGSGKTTLLKLMLGLLKPSQGSIKLFGQDIQQFREWFKIGYVPQKTAQFDAQFPLTVQEVVAMGTIAKRGLFRFPTKEDAQIVSQSLKQVEMQEFKNTLVGKLSGGQQQRVFIARALATHPEIIVLDEPTVGVDEETQGQFYALLQKLNKDLHLTLILVSHDLEVVASHVSEIAIINRDLLWYGMPEELGGKEQFQTAYEEAVKHSHHHHLHEHH